ncbi:MAG TPA: hypothetical protein EYP64_05005, partial [Desulfarculaceae bacterium]|nr:hypothetical protein [Desulfarculaceae bacterium]
EQIEKWKNELTRASHRHYTEGFIDKPNTGVGESSRELQYLESSAYIRSYRFCALVLEVLDTNFEYDNCLVRLNVKDRLTLGAEIEVITPDMKDFMTTIVLLEKENGDKLDVAHPGTIAVACCQGQLQVGNILRQPVAGKDVTI